MDLYRRKSLLIFVIFFISSLVSAQNAIIKGKVTDEKSQEPLPYVNIGVKGMEKGTFSDSSGFYKIEIPQGQFILVYSSIGYEKLEKAITINDRNVHGLDVSLKSTSKELNTVVVSASKYAQKIQESISTIEVVKPELIHNANIQTIDKAVEQVPGVAVIDNEPQIRSGSGFSSGLGSRVMILVDEIPVLRGDAGRPVWDFLPIDDIDQIEVVKGASSVLYGSSALNGAINVRTSWPKENVMNKFTVTAGMYSKPSRKFDTPWSGSNPLQYGVNISHSQKIENFDLSVGGSFYNDQGYIGPIPEAGKIQDSLTTSGTYNQRIKFNFNTRIRSKNVEGLSYGLNGNFMYQKNAEAFFWYDADTNIFRPFPQALSTFKAFVFYLDPFLRYFGKKGGSHSLKNRFFYDNTAGTNNQSSLSMTLFNEYQFQKKFKKMEDIVLVFGIINSYVWSSGKVFSGVLAADSTTTAGVDGHYTSENFAVCAQIEKKFFNRLNVLIGGRWEYYKLGTFEDNRPIFRAGASFQVARGSFIRSSIGQGYRFPSIGERYITTSSGRFGFYPNPNLNPETSISIELGFKQVYKLGNFVGIADLAIFQEEYDNYIEFNYGVWGRSPDFAKNSGFKFFNTGPTRIRGVEAAITGEGEVARNFDISVLVGYTYSVPQALDPHYEYYASKIVGDYNTYATSSTDTTNNILKYRIQSLVKSDLQLTFKKISGGISMRYYGFMQNIDRFFYDKNYAGYFATGIKKYRTEHDHGTSVFDCRISYLLKDFKFSVVINNLLNTEYSLRPLTIESPRTTSIQVVYKI
ncbi:MAG: TonB-dependent receptor [Bacteroidetes bacterium]|nr:TonB-dependent receptor [Bacteroidota bacterium]